MNFWTDMTRQPARADYSAFLKAKVKVAPDLGFAVADWEVNPILKDHQRALVRWAVKGGRRAICASFGLGKSVIQLETVRLTLSRLAPDSAGFAPMGLIVCPLGVRQEFVRDGRMLGLTVRFIRTIAEVGLPGLGGADIYVTNYETVRDGKLNPNAFEVVSLDEASVLRSFGSKTFQTFLPLFDRVRFRFVATATPSPNRYKELIHYAGFLGVMDTGQALTRFFQRDSTQAGNLTLYPHKEEEFFLWLNSWAIFLQKPSDLGFSDEGYDLPPLEVVFHEVKPQAGAVAVDRDGQLSMLTERAVDLTGAAKAKRETLPWRIAKLVQVIDTAPDDHWIVWHHLEAERLAIAEALPEARSVYGSQDLDEREETIIGFSDGAFPILSAKPVIAGSGCNFQRHCHRAVFVGVDFKFNDFIQAVHRIQRFQQPHPVQIHIIHAEAEREVVRELMAKWDRDKVLRNTMTAILKKHGLDPAGMVEVLTRAMGVPERMEASGAGWIAAHNDCVDECRRMPDDSVDLVVTSIPFSNHYEYSPNYADFGHTDGDAHFFAQMDHLTPELMRVLKPGRRLCVHVKDRILFGSVTGKGTPTVNPFHAKCIAHYMAHGFAYMGLRYIDTDVVRENNQTYRLAYGEMLKDATKMGAGSPEFMLLFRKLPTDRSNAYADEPVPHDREGYSLARWQIDADARWRSSGDRVLTPEEIMALPEGGMVGKAVKAWSQSAVYDFETHLRIGEALDASGVLPRTWGALAPGSFRGDVWHDISRIKTLNADQVRAGAEKHLCPLQFDIVDRCIEAYSNPGDLVFDPFGGLSTVAVRALKAGRRGRTVELNPHYWADGVRHCQRTEAGEEAPTLFGLEAAEVAEAAE